MEHKKVLFAAEFLFILWAGLADASPGITYHGRLLKPNGQAVTSTSVQFKVQIRTPLPTNCLLYEEIHTKDLSTSAGTFAVTINDGTATVLNTEPYTLDRVFQNRGTFSFTAGKCAGSDSEYTPNATDGRSLYVAFNDGSFADWEPLPSQAINFVPAALESVTVGGHKPANFFRVVDSGTLHTLAPWSAANYQKLVDLIANTTISGGNASIGGNAAGFTGSLSGDVTGGQSSTRVEKIQGYDVSNGLPSNGQVLTWNNAGSRWEPVTPSSSATPAGPASGDLSGNYPSPVIANSAVTTAKISDGAVTTAKLQDGSSSGQIFRFDGSDWQIAKLNYRDLINNVSASPWPLASCTAGQAVVWLSASDAFSCQSIAIDGSNIVDGSVDTVDLADGSVTTPKIQDGAVTNQKIVSVAVNKVTSGAGLYLTYAPNNVACANGEILKKTANGWECGADNNAGGTVTSVTGTTPISVASGTTTPVISLDAAGVTNTHLANDAVTTGKILDGTILNADIADGTITATKLATSVTDGLWSSGSGNVYRATGNVGIGTASPSSALHIAPAGSAILKIDADAGDSTNGNAQVMFINDLGHLGDIGMARSGLAAPYANSLLIRNQYASGDILFGVGSILPVIFKSSGNVGIGTAAPSARLQIDSSSTNIHGLQIGSLASIGVSYSDGNMVLGRNVKVDTVNNIPGQMEIMQTATGGAAAIKIGSDLSGTNNDGIQFHVAGASVTGGNVFSSEAMRIAPSGNVGIGITVPADKLEVAGRIRATHICAADGTNCKDLTNGWTAGTVTSVSGAAPIAVTGTSTPVISLNAAGVTNTHLANDAVTSAKILDGTIATADLSNGSVTDIKIGTMSVNKITSAATQYLTYAPNGVACTNGQVLKKTANGWECGADNNAGGTVTSVGLALPSIFTVSGSPVTTSGTLTGTLATQAQNTVFAGPLSGTAAPIFRTLQIADIKSSVSGNFLTGSSCAANQGLVYSSVSDTISCQTISGTTPAGAAGGDLTGTYPNPTIAASTVTSAKILDGTIAAADLANGTITATKLATSVTDGLWGSGSGNVYRSTGNVGIGTASPTRNLQVDGGVSHSVIKISNNTTGSASGDGLDLFVANTSGESWIRNNEATPLVFGTSGVERMRIDASGKIGVGATAPLAKFQVALAGSLLTDYTARFQSSAAVAGAGGILFDQNSNYSYKVHTFGTSAITGKMIFSYIDPSTGAVVNDNNLVLSDGNVGIGVAAPSAKLDVAGRIRATHICADDGTNCKDLTTAWTGGSVTTVGATAPLTVTNPTTTPSIAITNGTVTGQMLRWSGSAWQASTDGSALTALNASNLSSGSIPAARIAASTIATTHLASGAVTSAKILDGTIVGADIANGTIADAKISGLAATKLSGTIPAANFPALTGDVTNTAGSLSLTVTRIRGRTIAATAPANGQVLKWNNTTSQWEPSSDSSGGTGTVTSVTSANADIGVTTTTTTPVLTLNSGAGANQILKLNASSQIPAVSGALLTNLNASSLATGTLPAARIAASTITSSHIANGTIVDADIANGTITASKLATAIGNGLWTVSGGNVYRSSGNVGIGTASPQSSLQVIGYAQLGTVSGAPPSTDCDSATEHGRMKVDPASATLYICTGSGWAAVTGSTPSDKLFTACTNEASDGDGTGDIAACVEATSNNGTGTAAYRVHSCLNGTTWTTSIIRWSAGQWQGYAANWVNCTDGSVQVMNLTK